MAALHALTAQLALALAAIGVLWALVVAFRRGRPGPMLLGELIWLAVMLGLAGLLGALVAVTAGPPKDPLHVLYGLLAAATLPGALVVGRGRPPAQRAAVLAIALVVLLILVLRLFQTGG